MISRMSHVSLFVPDQEEALAFYTEKLGFKLHTDALFESSRWITIVAPQDPGLEISLMQGTPISTHGIPLAAFITNNFRETYDSLLAKKVVFLTEPKSEPWGIGAVFADCAGNIFYLNQPKD